MNLVRACYDWRGLTALGVLGIGIYVVAPGLIAAAIPLLLLAVCPLSMLLMMNAMSGQQPSSGRPAEPIGEAHEAVLRQELMELERRQEQLSGELRAIETARAEHAEGSDAVASPAR